MKTITKGRFLADVMHEIDMLKKHATDKEKSNLNFFSFNPDSKYSCIYGQLTGSCVSWRAKKLMKLSCIRVFDRKPDTKGEVLLISGNISDNLYLVNGSYNSQMWDGNNRDGFRYMSSVEGYILASDAKNAEIIAYIKGEQGELSL